VHEPGLEVAGAGLDDNTWVEAVGREPDERGLVEIVKRCEAMLPDGRIIDLLALPLAKLSPWTVINASCRHRLPQLTLADSVIGSASRPIQRRVASQIVLPNVKGAQTVFGENPMRLITISHCECFIFPRSSFG
jgi:hypothetical protein